VICYELLRGFGGWVGVVVVGQLLMCSCCNKSGLLERNEVGSRTCNSPQQYNIHTHQ
jgi:hypothetical protein